MAESTGEKIDLKVGIYPWIPDLGNDKLKSLKDMIKLDFQSKHPHITVTISSDWNPYSLEDFTKNLSHDSDSFDILEVDTILLGEIVEMGNVQEFDPAVDGLHDDALRVGMDAVTYKGSCYGVPTLNCGNFLLELISGQEKSDSEVLSSLETGNHSLGDLQDIVRRYHDLFKGTSSMVGNFRGKWTLPLMYVDAYVDEHGASSVTEAVDAPIEAQTKVLDNMKLFMKFDESTDGTNDGESGKYESAAARDESIMKSDHIMLYGYSEYLSQVMSDKMQQGKHIHASCIVSPPLGKENQLLAFTDAAIVNKSHYSGRKAAAILAFLKFYTSLDFRNKYAEGKDLKCPHPPRYVMIAREDFYTTGFGAKNKNYKELRKAFDHAVAAPNHGLADKHKKMDETLVQMLKLGPVHTT
jgi:hypothetical protein